MPRGNKHHLQPVMLLVLALFAFLATGHAAKQQPGKMMKRTIQLVKQDLAKADSLSHQLLRLDTVQNSDTLRSKAHMLRGIVTYYIEQYRLSNYYYRQAFKTDYGSSDTQFLAESWNNMAVNHELMKQYDSAFLFYTRSLPYKKHLGDTLSVANTRLNMAVLETKRGNFKACDSLIHKILPRLRRYNDTSSVGYAYQNLGYNETQKGNNVKAINYYNKALQIFKTIDHQHGALELYKNLAARYQEAGRYERALSYLDTLRRQLNTYPKPSFQYQAKLIRIENLIMLNRAEKAGDILTELKEAKQGLAKHGVLQKFYMALMGWQAMQGNMKEFQQIRKTYRNRKDSLLDARLKQKAAELRVMHQVDKQKALLAKKDDTIQIKSKNNRRLIIALIIVTGLLIALLILYLKNKRLWNIITNLNLAERLTLKARPEKAEAYPSNGNGSATRTENLFRQIEHLVKEEEWYQDKTLSVKMLARELATNELYISKAINACSGMNFNAYINQYRIKVAKKLLIERGNALQSVSEIGLEVGFSHPSTFSRTFKKLTGFSPSTFYNLKSSP